MTSLDHGSPTPRTTLMGITLALVLIAVALILIVRFMPTGAMSSPIRADPNATYDPVRAGEEAPEGFRQLLFRDQITPVYEPEFTTADQLDWPDDMLVVAVAGTSQSKAYPVTHLNQREMVIDYIDGEPILVSW